ncbi:MAG TPA: sugar ABC transporter permease [Clostridiaceae bacterium]|nr:sugar ABC transporter permease [Clostridiaceae bacterium]
MREGSTRAVRLWHKEKFEPIKYILPAFLVYTVFMTLPLFGSLLYSFFEWQGIGEMRYVGIQNYIKLFTQYPYNERLVNVIINNFKFFFLTIIFQNIVALGIAILLSFNLKGKNFFRFTFFLPTTLSVIIVGYLWTLLLNPTWGPINSFLKSIGLEKLALNWLGNTKTSLICITIANAWQYMGIPMMIFLAGINNIDESINESSIIDGCNELKRMWYITLPLLRPIIGMTTILVFVRNFSAFEIVYAMAGTSAGPLYSTDIFGTFFYRTLFGETNSAPQDFGMGATIATCMLFIISLGVIIWQIWDKRVNE